MVGLKSNQMPSAHATAHLADSSQNIDVRDLVRGAVEVLQRNEEQIVLQRIKTSWNTEQDCVTPPANTVRAIAKRQTKHTPLCTSASNASRYSRECRSRSGNQDVIKIGFNQCAS